ncbi:hypothetical protein B0H19DRAFT_1058970 [Mycena capillaripes]|nr:hypothetical protein B0H19DRAFT_1058970 [Mycena capillaripes]
MSSRAPFRRTDNLLHSLGPIADPPSTSNIVEAVCHVEKVKIEFDRLKADEGEYAGALMHQYNMVSGAAAAVKQDEAKTAQEPAPLWFTTAMEKLQDDVNLIKKIAVKSLTLAAKAHNGQAADGSSGLRYEVVPFPDGSDQPPRPLSTGLPALVNTRTILKLNDQDPLSYFHGYYGVAEPVPDHALLVQEAIRLAIGAPHQY